MFQMFILLHADSFFLFDQIHLFTAGVHMSVIGLHVMCCTAKIRKE